MNNYKLLPALASLLETKNITFTAQLLNVTQSAMSKTLAQIRDAFNDPILVRQGNQYVLTARGEQLKDQLPELLTQLDDLYLPPRFEPTTCERKFTFSYTAFVASSILPTICTEVEKQAPLASVECQLWQYRKLDHLATGSNDLVATMAFDAQDNLHGKHLGDDEYVVLMSKQHPLAHESLTIEEYGRAKHIQINGVVDARRQVDEVCAKHGIERQVFARVPSFLSAAGALARTQTLLTAPLHTVIDYARHFDLVMKPFPVEIKPHSYYLFWHAKQHHDPEHRWFRELCFPALQNYLNHAIDEGQQMLAFYSEPWGEAAKQFTLPT